MVGRPSFILSLPRTTQVYRLLLLLANVRNDSYYGLIEVEVEVNGSDVGVSTERCQRKKVGRMVDESLAVAVAVRRRRRWWGQARGSSLAQVVYEERNRSSRPQSGIVITITITFAIVVAVRRAHKTSKERSAAKSAGQPRTTIIQRRNRRQASEHVR